MDKNSKTDEDRDYEIYQEHLIEKARRDILSFTLLTKPDYQTNWHHLRLADKLNSFARGDIRFLMVFMPPRHGKSELVSRRFPAWLHGLYPDAEIMAASYLDSLAGDMTVEVQNIIDSDIYKKIFPDTKIFPPGTSYAKGTRNSAEHHIVGRRGKYRGQGVGGSFTGKGANFIIIDDPIKGREIADSPTFRERLWNFWNNDLFTRLETNLKTGRLGQVLITQTRWHEDDLSGRLLDQMSKNKDAIQWDILNYPAIRSNIDDPTDIRQMGESLWPAKYSLETLDQIKVSGGPRMWSSLYQQTPVPDGGGLFNENMFEFTDMPYAFDWKFITADTAYKDKQESDFTVFAAWGVLNGELYLIDIFRKQIKSSEVEAAVTPFIKNQMAYGYRGTYIEPKGHGIYLNQALAIKGLMIPGESTIKEFYNDRRFDKVERANNVVPNLASHKVKINKNISMKEELLTEVLTFPKAKHDDFVDCLVDALKMVFIRKLSILDVL